MNEEKLSELEQIIEITKGVIENSKLKRKKISMENALMLGTSIRMAEIMQEKNNLQSERNAIEADRNRILAAAFVVTENAPSALEKIAMILRGGIVVDINE